MIVLDKDEVARERGWLMATELVIMSTCLLKAFFCWACSLMSIYLGHKYLHFQRCLSTYLFSTTPVISFPIVFPPIFWPSSQIISYCPWFRVDFHLWYSRKVNNQIYWLMFCSLAGFPFKSSPEWNYSAIVAHSPFLCSVNISCRTIGKIKHFFP